MNRHGGAAGTATGAQGTRAQDAGGQRLAHAILPTILGVPLHGAVRVHDGFERQSKRPTTNTNKYVQDGPTFLQRHPKRPKELSRRPTGPIINGINGPQAGKGEEGEGRERKGKHHPPKTHRIAKTYKKMVVPAVPPGRVKCASNYQFNTKNVCSQRY